MVDSDLASYVLSGVASTVIRLPHFRKGITLAKKGSDSQIQKGTRNERDEERGRRGVDADGLIEVPLQIHSGRLLLGRQPGLGGGPSPHSYAGQTAAWDEPALPITPALARTCTLARQFCLSAAARCHARPLLGRSVRPHPELRDPPHHPCTHPSTR